MILKFETGGPLICLSFKDRLKDALDFPMLRKFRLGNRLSEGRFKRFAAGLLSSRYIRI